MQSEATASTMSSLVIVADADAEVRSLLETLLVADGHAVQSVGSLDGLAGALDRLRPDIIVTDGDCRTVDELAVTSRRLLHLASDTPVLLLSSLDIEPAVIRVAGFADVIAKPFDIDVLVSRVRALVDARAGRGADAAVLLSDRISRPGSTVASGVLQFAE